MAKTVVATTARATTRVAKATSSGATTTMVAAGMMVATATMVATVTTVRMMTPNGDKDNKNGNSKNNNKGTTTATQQRQQRGVSRDIVVGDTIVPQKGNSPLLPGGGSDHRWKMSRWTISTLILLNRVVGGSK